MREEESRSSHAVFERQAAELVRGGAAIVELIARGKRGTRDVDGWYLMLRKPDGQRLLILTVKELKVKFIETIAGVFKMLERLSAKEALVPLEAQIESESELWAMHARLNSDATKGQAG